jgi:hypothetical protein
MARPPQFERSDPILVKESVQRLDPSDRAPSSRVALALFQRRRDAVLARRSADVARGSRSMGSCIGSCECRSKLKRHECRRRGPSLIRGHHLATELQRRAYFPWTPPGWSDDSYANHGLNLIICRGSVGPTSKKHQPALIGLNATNLAHCPRGLFRLGDLCYDGVVQMNTAPTHCECPESDCLNDKEHKRGDKCSERAVPSKPVTRKGWHKVNGLWHCVRCWARNFKM